jgi:hypothetical protein
MQNVTDFVLAQYEKNSQGNSAKQNISSEDRLKRYFAPILPKGSASGDKRVRIIPPKEGGSPFVEVFFHEIQVDGKWVKLYDPAQNGKIQGVESPLNDVYRSLQNTGVESDKLLSYGYRPRKFYVVKVIDRENEQDGVKYWRFKHSSKNDGILDKIVALWKIKGDVTNADNGRDLIISMNLSKKPNGGEYTTITSIFPDDPAPLSTNPAQQAEWINDASTWEDVYAKKPVEYLRLVAQGIVPKWNSETKSWGGGDEETADMGMTQSPSSPVTNESYSVPVASMPANTAPANFAPVVDPQFEEPEDDDLPF